MDAVQIIDNLKASIDGRVRHGFIAEDVERVLIESTLQHFGGHREKTAKALGMGIRTLGMRLAKWKRELA